MTATDIPRTRKPRGEGASRRGEILAAARRLFLAEGFEHTTMRRIASVVGLSATSLYVYFPDKEAILRAIAEATFAELLAVLEASQDPSQPLAARFRAGFRAYVDFGLARPDEYRLIFSKRLGVTTPGPRVDPCAGIEAADQSFAVLENQIAGLIAAGLLPAGEVCALAETLWACMHGITLLALDHGDHLVTAPGAMVDSLIGLILQN